MHRNGETYLLQYDKSLSLLKQIHMNKFIQTLLINQKDRTPYISLQFIMWC